MTDHLRQTKLEPSAFSAEKLQIMIEGYTPSLLRYLSARLGDSSEAEDIAQEAFLRLSRVKNSDLILKPESYLFRIAANLASELLVKQSTKGKTTDLESLTQLGADSDGDKFQRHIEAQSDIAHMEAIVEKLPPLYKAVLLLRKRDGYSYNEIADKLSISTHAVNRYLSGALQKCRKGLYK